MEANIMDAQLSNEADTSTNPKNADSLMGMTEQEMSEHLSLCLKLAAENKINTKNAFGLHLIGIMRRLVKKDMPDLQFASLSLQASSKIYAGRVEALYKDTFAFHNQLQTIIYSKKASVERKGTEDEYDDGSEERRERRKTKAKQVYLTTEENVAFKSEASSSTSTFPHANFITIKTAFTNSRSAPKLLESLNVENDFNQLCCGKASLCFQPSMPIKITDFFYPEKKRVLMKKALNLHNSLADSVNITSSDVFLQSAKVTPTAVPEQDEIDDDSFCIATTPIKDDEDVDDIIERFSVLDITADMLANDLSLAIGNDNTVDKRLLPPNSALKKILNTAEKSRLNNKNQLNKRQEKEKPVKEPFFNKQRIVDKSILKKGRKIEMTDNGISNWKINFTTECHTSGPEMFSTVLAEHFTATNNNKEALKITYKLLQEKDDLAYLNGYFRKPLQLWNRFRQQPYTCLIRPSSLGVCLRNESDLQDTSNSFGVKSNCIIQSFQNLSICASQGDSDNDENDYQCMAPDDNENDLFSPETPAITRSSRTSGIYEDDLKSVMVTPPELVKPINMKFQTEPITLNTKVVKNAIWEIIEKNEETLLTDVHEKLKVKFIKEKLPLQYAFAMLLLLANEKCLLLENVSNGTDVKIMKDVNELEEIG